jgi:hypothetical protein
MAALSHTAEPPSLNAHVTHTCTHAVLPQMSLCCGQWVRGVRVDADHNRTRTTHVRVPPPAPHPHTTSAVPLQPSNTRTPELHAHRHVLSFVGAFSVAAFLFTCGSQSCTAHTFCSLPKTVALVAANVHGAVMGCSWLTFLPPLFAGGLDTSCVLVWLREQGEYHPVPQWGFSVCNSATSSALRSLALDSHSTRTHPRCFAL